MRLIKFSRRGFYHIELKNLSGVRCGRPVPGKVYDERSSVHIGSVCLNCLRTNKK